MPIAATTRGRTLIGRVGRFEVPLVAINVHNVVGTARWPVADHAVVVVLAALLRVLPVEALVRAGARAVGVNFVPSCGAATRRALAFPVKEAADVA